MKWGHIREKYLKFNLAPSIGALLDHAFIVKNARILNAVIKVIIVKKVTMSPFSECLSAKKKRSEKGISKQFRKILSHFDKSVSTWKRLASSQIARTFEARNHIE